ncbi:MAG: hypothetical protein KME31_22375 [Tolypothrix carrinoi HA7290-LM1]|jgi:hypothetical protein|nr:hypothetical protein [Tolypothrix carrinoi HA7290-LM1]
MPERWLIAVLVSSRVEHNSDTAPQLTRHSSHAKSEIMDVRLLSYQAKDRLQNGLSACALL